MTARTEEKVPLLKDGAPPQESYVQPASISIDVTTHLRHSDEHKGHNHCHDHDHERDHDHGHETSKHGHLHEHSSHDVRGHRHSHSHDHSVDHHSHDHAHGLEAHRHASRKVLTLALILTVVMMCAEVVGGYIANSLALMTDAGHLLTDVGALCLSLFAAWLAKRPSTSKMSFGFHRAEILGAVLSALTIWLLAGILIQAAIGRIKDPPPVEGFTVMVTACFGLVVNIIVAKILHGGHEHSINVRAAMIHVLGDCLQSIGVIIAGAIMWYKPSWTLVDPVMTICFSILVLVTTIRLLIESITVLMEATPAGIDPVQVAEDLQSIPAVAEVHDLHIWSITAGLCALSVHLVTNGVANGGATTNTVLEQAQDILRTKHSIGHTTIQIEEVEESERKACTYGGIHH
eukprot:CAMPEP_0184656854 /NCGR_PEP_ID=MMETSP0308-20130426/16804_1 /TAXON_ID=38269 /ORGANISM="Gloeochaete witrockiana, Strain SAG 46.84" /LENGTH=402 /DNA_ID=CAMNT_0027094165 /DNA_START=174 /DNA_END=1382 /DNA_ORIENTATION=+